MIPSGIPQATVHATVRSALGGCPPALVPLASHRTMPGRRIRAEVPPPAPPLPSRPHRTAPGVTSDPRRRISTFPCSCFPSAPRRGVVRSPPSRSHFPSAPRQGCRPIRAGGSRPPRSRRIRTAPDVRPNPPEDPRLPRSGVRTGPCRMWCQIPAETPRLPPPLPAGAPGARVRPGSCTTAGAGGTGAAPATVGLTCLRARDAA